MIFRDYMNSLPNVKVETIKTLAELTSSSIISVYRWINGSSEPPLLKKKIIADFLKKDVSELWPNE